MEKKIRVLILAGGKGTRLSTVVQDVPKPMAPIAERPFLDYMIRYLVNHKLTNITLLTGYKADLIRDYFGNGESFGAKISYSHEDEPLGTGGAIKLAIKNSSEDEFLILNGDSFFDLDVLQFISSPIRGKLELALKYVENASRYGLVELDDSERVKKFLEKQDGASGTINSGIYFCSRNIIENIKEGFVSLESEVFPVIAKSGELHGRVLDGHFIDIGIPEDYRIANEVLPNWMGKSTSEDGGLR